MIERAYLQAGVAIWTPHMLRHTRATMIRMEYDPEAAEVIPWHSKPDTTVIRAARDLNKFQKAMTHVG